MPVSPVTGAPVQQGYAIDAWVERPATELRGDTHMVCLDDSTLNIRIKHNGNPVVELVGGTLTVHAPGFDVVREMVRRANAYDELRAAGNNLATVVRMCPLAGGGGHAIRPWSTNLRKALERWDIS